MGRTLLTIAIVLASGSAMASSIEVIKGNRTGNDSVVSVLCEACPPFKAKVKTANIAPSLTPGTQDISIRDVNGKKQIVRTEAWLGGSPVTYVSNNPAWLPAEDAATAVTEKTPTIDTLVKTSAIENVVEQDRILPVAADVSSPLALDGLSLRPSQ
ncbi:plant virulence effector HPE1-like domain-containing protein [Agrobacterium rosae]|uniref:plant virulence effector HPE1-like domain-containing protein n=1 Tax=Agrobacterium rosae TaxID=1972867 RepID=UPI003B9F7A33